MVRSKHLAAKLLGREGGLRSTPPKLRAAIRNAKLARR
jgi:hypothetical protein